MMKFILSILVTLISFASNGQVVKANSNYRPFATVGSSCPYNLTFVSTTNWTFNAGDSSWGPITYAGVGNGEGIGNPTLIGDGYIQATYQDASAQATAIFLTTDEAPTSPYWGSVQFGLYVSSGVEYTTAVSGSFTGTGINAVDGDLFRVIRIGTTIKAQFYGHSSRSDGYENQWNDLYTYTTSSSGTLWMGGSSADPGNPVFLFKPKYCN